MCLSDKRKDKGDREERTRACDEAEEGQAGARRCQAEPALTECPPLPAPPSAGSPGAAGATVPRHGDKETRAANVENLAHGLKTHPGSLGCPPLETTAFGALACIPIEWEPEPQPWQKGPLYFLPRDPSRPKQMWDLGADASRPAQGERAAAPLGRKDRWGHAALQPWIQPWEPGQLRLLPACMHVCVRVCVHVCVHACMCVCMHIRRRETTR